ncbi:MAG: GDSL-type esterase/lipase family protein [Oscillospiraceae bacterium]|nr:GDSL-type esterase/lipase family protein [Oscillospiraceae bacterium]
MKKKYGMIIALLLLTGCGESKMGEPVTSYAQTSEETASVSQTEELTSEAVHDIDPEAEGKGMEGVPYFYSPRSEEVTFVPSEESVKFNGRHIEHNDTCYLSYTGSAVRFNMTGDRAEAVLVSNGGAYSDRQQGWVGVEINGELTKRIRLEDGEQSYVLYEGEELKNAEIAIVKLTENQMTNTGVKSVTCNASRIAPAAEKELSVEIIGDSITCGYSNEAEGPEYGFNCDYENGAATYGYLTAKALDADYSLVCISGLGLISNYTDTVGEREDYLLLNDVYGYTDTNFEQRRGMEPLTEWDFGEGSDIVVINIGTNDYSYTGRDEDRQYEFYEAYYTFLGDVREANPDAEIVCTMGIMGAELFGQIEKAAEDFSRDNSDDHIHTMKFDYQSEEDGYGGDYHPSVATHKKAAEQLTAFLETLI